MRHYLTMERGGFRFVCNIPSVETEKLEFAIEVFQGDKPMRQFTVPLSRMPNATVVDLADTVQLQWAIDDFVDRGTGRRTKKRVR